MIGGLDYLYLFAQSSLLETGAYALAYRRLLSPRESATLVTAANAITHPLVFFGFLDAGMSHLAGILAAEAFAIGAETALHRRFAVPTWRRAALAAAAANLVSWQLAPILTWLALYS